MPSSSWQPPVVRATAVACVGEDQYIDALLRAALATRRSMGPIEEFCRVSLLPEGEDVRVLSKAGEVLGELPHLDAQALRPRIDRVIADEGEMWCDARISGNESMCQWRMQIWVYFADYATTV